MDTNYNPASVSCNIHQAMDTILQLVPTAPSVLMPLLTKNYPFKGRGPDIQVSCYCILRYKVVIVRTVSGVGGNANSRAGR
ncbi:uncharacterized protein LOC135350826 isoform X2 [Halichondria panicea]|uniref:uncharacterized protein LOC135350826 isoform X2 n=1 Tax=Halichondria panicea TaxID=6063 RepID=UPI00312B31C0